MFYFLVNSACLEMMTSRESDSKVEVEAQVSIQFGWQLFQKARPFYYTVFLKFQNGAAFWYSRHVILVV